MCPRSPPNDLADDLLAVHAERSPVAASLAGLPGYDDRLPDPTDAAEQALSSRAARIVEQALSYMTGRLEIQRLRRDTERTLGDRFDVRAFHDTVLGGGALPLTVLADVVADWIAAVR
jgi:adenine-specific DNA methylase